MDDIELIARSGVPVGSGVDIESAGQRDGVPGHVIDGIDASHDCRGIEHVSPDFCDEKGYRKQHREEDIEHRPFFLLIHGG